jgi:ribosomal-protein-alanine N-acetyltransferase
MQVLQTPRLSLRWFTTDDAAFIVELLNDPGWLAFIGDRGVRNESQARRWIDERLIVPTERQGFGLWAVERREDAALLGMCGLVKREGLPEIDLGYALLPRHRGAGYAREAAAACLAHAADKLGKREVLAITRPENVGSMRLLEAIGMRRLTTIRLPDVDHEDVLFAWRADHVAKESS